MFTLLFSLYNDQRGDNFTTTDSNWQAARVGDYIGNPSYVYYRIEGRILSAPASGTVPLVHWYSQTRQDNFTTSDPQWRAAPAEAGYARIATLGHVFDPDKPQPEGTIPLYSAWSPSREDHLLTTDSRWRGTQRGQMLGRPDYVFLRLEGYIHPGLWGWADLHAHPASHLAFGADANGDGGIFWGKPGTEYKTSIVTLPFDMPACAPDKHGGFDADKVRHETHKEIMSKIDSITGLPHLPFGGPLFANWPSALSLTHQQMHITSLRRAYDGGQRLLIASATDNQLLSALWEKVHYDPGGAVPLTTADFDFKSARQQLAFIKFLVVANATWMEIALSAADARRIISANKMAVILSIEMDSLTSSQIQTLVREDGVRHVVPIHLINNSLGGCAVYDDAFNAANNFVNGTRRADYNNLKNDAFFEVTYDTNLSGRLHRPETLSSGFNLFSGGAVRPVPVDDATFASLQYELPPQNGGHRNSKGLLSEGFRTIESLANLGVLVDLAHMSLNSASSALQLAVSLGYPVMDSHTGLRDHDEKAENERALLREHARTISKIGGMIGLGTQGRKVDKFGVPIAAADMDTIGVWLSLYRDLLELMNGVGAAIGSDINGFASQIPFAAQAVTYPLTVASVTGVPPEGYTPPTLEHSMMGIRTFDFKTDGIAHYGMLADLMQAVHQQAGSQEAINALFRSSNDTVEMWERCEMSKVRQYRSQLFAGQRLRNNEQLTSPNGRFVLWMQSDGNLVLYDGPPSVATAYWNSGTFDLNPDSLCPTHLDMQSDGHLVLYNDFMTPSWSSGIWGPDYIHPYLELQDDGNLVIYHNGKQPIWATNTVR